MQRLLMLLIMIGLSMSLSGCLVSTAAGGAADVTSGAVHVTHKTVNTAGSAL